MANCPRCKKPMLAIKKESHGLEVDRCTQCEGLFFDKFQLQKFEFGEEVPSDDMINEDAHLKLQEHPTDEHLDCPKCKGIKMMHHFASVKRKIMIDECGQCGGVWLDPGELTELRSEFKSDDERKAAIDKMMGAEFGAQMAKEHLEVDRDRQIAKTFNTINYYLNKRRLF